MAEQLCPACYRLIPVEARVCPGCGADLAALSARSYRDKLVAALGHPLDDVRLRAILALGLRGEAKAADALAESALRHPLDVIAGLAVVDALARLGDCGRDALARLAADHPASTVRNRALQAQQDFLTSGAPVPDRPCGHAARRRAR